MFELHYWGELESSHPTKAEAEATLATALRVWAGKHRQTRDNAPYFYLSDHPTPDWYANTLRRSLSSNWAIVENTTTKEDTMSTTEQPHFTQAQVTGPGRTLMTSFYTTREEAIASIKQQTEFPRSRFRVIQSILKGDEQVEMVVGEIIFRLREGLWVGTSNGTTFTLELVHAGREWCLELKGNTLLYSSLSETPEAAFAEVADYLRYRLEACAKEGRPYWGVILRRKYYELALAAVVLPLLPLLPAQPTAKQPHAAIMAASDALLVASGSTSDADDADAPPTDKVNHTSARPGIGAVVAMTAAANVAHKKLDDKTAAALVHIGIVKASTIYPHPMTWREHCRHPGDPPQPATAAVINTQDEDTMSTTEQPSVDTAEAPKQWPYSLWVFPPEEQPGGPKSLQVEGFDTFEAAEVEIRTNVQPSAQGSYYIEVAQPSTAAGQCQRAMLVTDIMFFQMVGAQDWIAYVGEIPVELKYLRPGRWEVRNTASDRKAEGRTAQGAVDALAADIVQAREIELRQAELRQAELAETEMRVAGPHDMSPEEFLTYCFPGNAVDGLAAEYLVKILPHAEYIDKTLPYDVWDEEKMFSVWVDYAGDSTDKRELLKFPTHEAAEKWILRQKTPSLYEARRMSRRSPLPDKYRFVCGLTFVGYGKLEWRSLGPVQYCLVQHQGGWIMSDDDTKLHALCRTPGVAYAAMRARQGGPLEGEDNTELFHVWADDATNPAQILGSYADAEQWIQEQPLNVGQYVIRFEGDTRRHRPVRNLTFVWEGVDKWSTTVEGVLFTLERRHLAGWRMHASTCGSYGWSATTPSDAYTGLTCLIGNHARLSPTALISHILKILEGPDAEPEAEPEAEPAVETLGVKDDKGKPDFSLLTDKQLIALMWGEGLSDMGNKIAWMGEDRVDPYEVVRVLEYGVAKYARDNWRLVPDFVNRYRAARGRHISARLAGDENDSESGLSHQAHAFVNELYLLELDPDYKAAQ